ncbi:hypothetical protein DRO41_00200 [Candidatus Bathyarchaeota archaeon]|nr:MAG: hypothetical protein DRO41_00200 [Candidatus Bathyarchaeota archaeon]
MKQNPQTWRCDKCGALLGFVDLPDVLRIKYKDAYTLINVVTGKTEVKVVCRKCGFINTKILKLA